MSPLQVPFSTRLCVVACFFIGLSQSLEFLMPAPSSAQLQGQSSPRFLVVCTNSLGLTTGFFTFETESPLDRDRWIRLLKEWTKPHDSALLFLSEAPITAKRGGVDSEFRLSWEQGSIPSPSHLYHEGPFSDKPPQFLANGEHSSSRDSLSMVTDSFNRLIRTSDPQITRLSSDAVELERAISRESFDDFEALGVRLIAFLSLHFSREPGTYCFL
eukprot:m.551495 g.551495  ORF g.551495 m.551495 type:complete len:215 (+) comp57734_c0_seq13:2221-2865(+)